MSNKKYISELTHEITSLKSKDEVLSFLRWILTPQEFEQLPLRLQIIKMLKKGVPQREVAKKLGVGIATVTRGAIELKKASINV